MATRIPDNVRSAIVDAVTAKLNAGSGPGTVTIYTGSQPSSANDTATGTQLAQFTLPDPAFPSASSGSADANSISDTTGDADGEAGWFRARDSDGNTVIDGGAGADGSGAPMILDNVNIAEDQGVSIESWTITMPAG